MPKENRLVLLKSANKLFRQGKIGPAIKEYNKILGIKPNDLEVRRIIGDLQLKQNNTSGAVEQFEWIADYYLKEGFFAKAIAMYKRITRLDPNYEGVSVKLAELYTKQGLIIEAKQMYLDLAEENKRKNNHKKALDMYKKILEFDRNNIKMRLLLADNYLREGLEDNAVGEYLTAADILMNKKDFQRAEELLLDTFKKVKNLKITEKLVNCYIGQEKEKNAIDLLTSLGSQLFKHLDLLKILGELYFKNNLINEAEKIYRKITEINAEETEIIMKLGRVYLQRNEYDKTYELFLPVIEKNIKEKKFEEATSLLRFIIASNNSYIPALQKLSSIFKLTGKKNNLIALYESLIPIYEQNEMKEDLKKILEELIELSDSSFTYQEQLARLTGKGVKLDDEGENEREQEFVNFNLRVVEDAIKESDYDKAVEILKKTADAFPKNLEVRLKLFDVYQLANDIEALLEEGIELMDLYKSLNKSEEHKKLFEKLYTLKPDDERLIGMAGDEKTSIEITFDREELKDNMSEISDPNLKEINVPDHIPVDIPEEIEDTGRVKDVFVLSEDDGLPSPKPEIEFEKEQSDSIQKSDTHSDKETSKDLSSVFTELDFYINDGYFGDAEKLIEQLRELYPENSGLINRINKLKQARGKNKKETDISDVLKNIDEAFEIKSTLADESEMIQDIQSSKKKLIEKDGKVQDEIKIKEHELPEIDNEMFEIEMEEPENTDNIPIVEIDKDQLIQSPSAEKREKTDDFKLSSSSEDLFQLGEDDKIIPTAPHADHSAQEDSGISSESDILDIDSIFEKEGSAAKEHGRESDSGMDTPFKDIDKDEVLFEGEEDLFKEEVIILEDDEYFEIEKVVDGELTSIEFWLKEVERQRTSTVEKNMMEIFEEFKKGVEEKIGQQDYDTRYNLGIAYKEMGLIEEAIHEFLISAKHPLKFFDSAGLLGICFRENGMYEDSLTWLEKALDTPDRMKEEYLAIRYEVVATYLKMENYQQALKTTEDIMDENPKFRNVSEIYDKLKKNI